MTDNYQLTTQRSFAPLKDDSVACELETWNLKPETRPVTPRLVTDPDDPAIEQFSRLQEAAYFDPSALIPGRMIPSLLRGEGPARQNLLLVAEASADGGATTVVGGALFHYLAEPNVGFSSFMGVAREARGQGIARRLHEARFRALDEAAGSPVEGVFIDVVNPLRLSAAELEREVRVGSDPWDRRRVFAGLGFRLVDVPYEQPVGGPNGGPVTNLDLLYCPHRQPAVTVPTDLVVRTMQAYWSAWLGDARAAQHAANLGVRAAGRADIPLRSPVPPRASAADH